MEKEDSLSKIFTYIELKSNHKSINPNLILFIRIYLHGSFVPSLQRLFFQHYLYKGIGYINNNYFSKSEKFNIIKGQIRAKIKL